MALIVAGVVCLAAARTAAADPLIFEYHGWHIDLTKARGKEPDQKMITAVKRQLDIVEQVNLKPQALQFMRTIKLWANPDLSEKVGPGHYGHATGVDFRVKLLDPQKPIILHELLHAYHDRMLPGGFDNADVASYFERARGQWPSESYMMSNKREFFAVTASVYLFGSIDREPHSRENIRNKQPRYYQWLADQFDGGRPRS
ncbi:hypothetical protein MXD81_01645 [Microbacteriaceae bacterium K1510]|nr:hypothetical protein [Microbacteriaceae bacterium K1510]